MQIITYGLSDPCFSPSLIRKQLLKRILSVRDKVVQSYKERTNFQSIADANTSYLIASIYDQFTEKKNRRNIQFEHFLPFPDVYAQLGDLKRESNKNSLLPQTKVLLQKLLKTGKLGDHVYAILAPYWDMTNKTEAILHENYETEK